MCVNVNKKNDGVDPVPKRITFRSRCTRRFEITVHREMKDVERNERSIPGASSRESAVINYEIHLSVELRPIMAAEFENFFP